MPESCCAVGCSQRRVKVCGIPFYGISEGKPPFEAQRRQDWIKNISRYQWSEEQISGARICGNLFVSSKRSDNPESVNWAPSVFNHARAAPKAKLVMKDHSRKGYEKLCEKRNKSMKMENASVKNGQLSEDNTDIDLVIKSCTDCSVKATENQLSQHELNETKILLSKYQINFQSSMDCKVKNIKNVRYFKRIEKSDKDVNFYTGLKNAKVFLRVVKRIEKHVAIIHRNLSLLDHVLIVLMKIKLALLHQDIEDRLNVKAAKRSQIWRTFVPIITKCLKNFIVRPDQRVVKRTLPKCFGKKFRDCICIIDCNKVFIERLKNLTARAQT